MKVYWKLTILLFSLCLRVAAPSCNDKLLIVHASVNSTVAVACPTLKGEEMNFYLSMGLEKVANHTYHSTKSPIETVIPIGRGLELRVSEQDRTVSFVLSSVTTKHSGLYSCEAWTVFPPPYEKVKDEPQTLVLVEGHRCPVKSVGHGAPVWVWALGFTVIAIYGLAVTVIALVTWLRLKRQDSSHSDYMNTKPRAPRGHRKKQGVQHPIRMGRF